MSVLSISVMVKSAMSVPWGDVSTAFYTTGIPNIEVFVPAPPKMILVRNDELLPPCIKTQCRAKVY